METVAPNPSAPAAIQWAHPIVQEWFLGRLGEPTEPQERGWPHILAGTTTLISAPTGSGKTLAAFLVCIDRLVRKALAGGLQDETLVVYISPLKALGNDIQKNLDTPLGEILKLAAARGLMMPEIRTAVRTGDTLMHDRRTMLRRPPHILVTTPESLYILLTAEKSRQILKSVETVIVDEIHAVADDKRGAHLALSLERLEALANRPPLRIGLSATQKPIELVANFLTGDGRPQPAVVQIGHQRKVDLAIEIPGGELGPVTTHEMWEEMYDRIAALVREHKSTLVFVNTRRLAERVAHHLAERLTHEAVATHHGSLSRKLRLEAERRLKAGEIQVLVATASLELGIDIGAVDLVCQIGSTRSISVAWQRIGRAGHWRGAIPKGRIFAGTRDELMECAALVRGMLQGDLDRLEIPEAPLDILAQQMVAMCAVEEWKEDDLFARIRRAYPYRDLQRSDFDEVVKMLTEGINARRGRQGAHLHHDQVNQRLLGRRGSRLIAITNGGAIPDNSLYTVVVEPEGNSVGTVDEDFAVESLRGDIILLGNASWRIRRVQAGKVLVEDAHGAAPTVPFWLGEAPSRTSELSQQVADLRSRIDEMVSRSALANSGLRPPTEVSTFSPLLPIHGFAAGNHPRASGAAPPESEGEPVPGAFGAGVVLNRQVQTHTGGRNCPADQSEVDAPAAAPTAVLREAAECRAAVAWLQEQCGLSVAGAEQLVEYVVEGRAVLGAVPTQTTVIAERFFDESGGMQLVIHAPFGGRINKAWGLALRKRFCRSFNLELQAAATDDGINISLSEQHSFPLADVFRFLHPSSITPVLEQAVLASPIFTARWRWNSSRALVLPRFQGGRRVPPQIQRMRADDLLASVFPDAAACPENLEGAMEVPDHPLVREVMKDALTEAMDTEGLKQVLGQIIDGTIRCVSVDTPQPSAFSHEILNANPYAYLDDAPLEERRARAVEMRRSLPDNVVSEIGRLDPAAIAEVRAEVWPDIRDAEELHDALVSLVAIPTLNEEGQADSDAFAGEFFSDFAYLRTALQASLDVWQKHFEVLLEQRRVGRVQMAGRHYWVSAEKAEAFRQIYPEARFTTDIATVQGNVPSRSDALLHLVNGWLGHAGPVRAEMLSRLLGIAANDVAETLIRLESSGTVLRGRFSGDGAGETEWCDRRLLARIHRLTIGTLRKEIEPVSAAKFMDWLLDWQHIARGTQVFGEHGTLEVLRQMQGFEAPANSWERHILSARVAGYDPGVLDHLCLTGALGWGRLSPHPAVLRDSNQGSHRVIPTSVAPITFFARDDSDWMLARPSGGPAEILTGLSATAKLVRNFLHERGASFFADIVRGIGKLKSEVENALWELVAAGVITADGFDNMRALIDPKRRAGQGRGRTIRPRHSAGRWSLLYSHGQDGVESRNAAIESTCWMLLKRYGIVFRELLTRESIVPQWREVLIALRRLEARGEVRGGRFVSGFLGEQFALPHAVESLRARRSRQPTGEVTPVSAADPLNLVGIIVPGDRIAVNSGRTISFRDGVFLEEERARVTYTTSEKALGA